MPELVFLRPEIADIRGPGRHFDRNAFDHFESVAFNADDLSWIVREQADFSQAEIDEDLRAGAIVAQIRLEPETEIGLHGIDALVLQLIGLDLVDQSDPAAFLIEIE